MTAYIGAQALGAKVYLGNALPSRLYQGATPIWLAGLPYADAPGSADFAWTATPVLTGGVYHTSVFARVAYVTAAVNLAVTSWTDMYSLIASLAVIGVYVNGAYLGSVLSTGMGNSIGTITLPGGSGKLVELITGPGQIPSFGTQLVSVAADLPLVKQAPPAAASRRHLFYGMSITEGSLSSPVMQTAAALKLRYYLAGLSPARSLDMDVLGGRQLATDASTGAAQDALAARLAARNPTDLYIDIGINDYIGASWNAAAFGAAYAAVLDKFHALKPAVPIICQTPIVKTVESANSQGSTLGDYRTAIGTACATRAWTTVVNGVPFMSSPGDLDADGIHPNNSGEVKLLTAWKAALGV